MAMQHFTEVKKTIISRMYENGKNKKQNKAKHSPFIKYIKIYKKLCNVNGCRHLLFNAEENKTGCKN